ncbi:hypothetical protein [Streptomyces sp. NPDC059003]|uniref:hypothetical protein n=1 Tax=Streptomyces sp. NPDC059003 TaxID=3346691 RepID=UPI0036B11A8F
MTERRRTSQQADGRRALADAVAGWHPRRGELVTDTVKKKPGVVVALPEDTNTKVYQLRPEGGGDGWPARLDDLAPRSDTPDDRSLVTDEAARPPHEEAKATAPTPGSAQLTHTTLAETPEPAYDRSTDRATIPVLVHFEDGSTAETTLLLVSAELERLYAHSGRLLADHDARWGRP